jgi:lysophospholipase L1-like esterase
MRLFFAPALMAIAVPAMYSQPGASQSNVTQPPASQTGVSQSSLSQPGAVLSAKDAAALFERSVQLVESTSATVPGLVRAAAPTLENARQALINLQTGPAGHTGLVYDLLIDVRSYLALADSLPKPYPFPEEARRQFAELRDAAERIESHFRASLDQKERQLRSPDRDNLRRYSDADAKLAKPGPGDKRIVFLGDSITDGWRLNEYFPSRDFVNRGISGQITGEMLGRMKADVIDLKPAGMLVLAGTNDIARGVPLSAIENNLTMIADLADMYKIKPIFASVLPISDYHKDVNPRYEMSKTRPPSAIVELNRWIEAFCKQRHYAYVDYFSKMVDATGYMRPELADDGLHPNSEGYRVMGPLALDTIDHHVTRPSVAAPAPAIIPSKKTVSRVRPPKPAPAEIVQADTAPAAAPPKPAPAKVTPPKPAPAETVQADSAPAAKPPKPAPAKVKAPKPAPAETVQADTAPAAKPPKPAPAKVKAPKPAPATVSKAAPSKPAPDTASTDSKKTDTKKTDKQESADGSAPKKKKESFWKRTYPDIPPNQ